MSTDKEILICYKVLTCIKSFLRNMSMKYIFETLCWISSVHGKINCICHSHWHTYTQLIGLTTLFYILVTVHLGIILINNRLDAQFLLCIFISILYMFRATLCSSSGESIVSIQHLVYVSLCRWPAGRQVGKELPDLHTGRSPTQSEVYQMLYWYNWLSWWWAQGCSKHVENRNKYSQK